MAQGTISKRAVDALKATGKTHYLWDNDPIGFGVRVTPAGAKSFIYQFRMGGRGSPVRREIIGRVEKIAPEKARERAHELAHLARVGTDPIEKKKADRKAKTEAKLTAEQLAFDAYCQRYLDQRVKPEGLASYGNIEMVFRLHAIPALRATPLPDLTKRNMVAVLDRIPATSFGLKRSAFAILNRMMNWAVARGDISANPMFGMKRPSAAPSRDRVLDDDELATIWHAAGKLRAPLGAFYRVLMMTGQRREEVAGMSWAELDRPTAIWTIPASRAKNGSAHLVPLAPAVVEELDWLALARQRRDRTNDPDPTNWPLGGSVMTFQGAVSLSGFSKAKRDLDAEIEKVRSDAGRLSPWRAHDLRRTLATGLQRLGVRFEVTEAVLNHVSGAKSGVAGVYQRHDWREEKRTALEAWARHVAAIVTPAGQTNVVPIGAAQKLTG